MSDPHDESPAARLHRAPRCTATAKHSGKRCRAAAVKGWTVCRMHGARGGAPKGRANGAYRHGEHTKVAVATRRAVVALVREAREMAARLGD